VSHLNEEPGDGAAPRRPRRRRSRPNGARGAPPAVEVAEDRAARDILREPLEQEPAQTRQRRLRLLPVAARRYIILGLVLGLAVAVLAGYQTWRVQIQGRELAQVQRERDALARERDALARERDALAQEREELSRELEAIRRAAPATPAGGEQANRVYVVKAGDSLWTIAVKLYGDGQMYTAIALENKITDPNHLEAGRVLVIPPVKPGR